MSLDRVFLGKMYRTCIQFYFKNFFLFVFFKYVYPVMYPFKGDRPYYNPPEKNLTFLNFRGCLWKIVGGFWTCFWMICWEHFGTCL